MSTIRAAIRFLLVAGLAITLVGASPTPAGAQSSDLLLLWSRGPAVAEWQQQLNVVRTEDIAVDGIYGPITQEATRDFQRRAGIQVDGIVGPQTRAAIENRGGAAPDERSVTTDVLRRGSEGAKVRQLQSELESQNYWVGPVDGLYGTLTEQAVIAFQKVNGLERDGVVDASTRSALDDPLPVEHRSDRPGLVMEVDKERQVLISVYNGQLRHVWNTSTGTGDHYTYEGRRYLADTPDGEWEIYRHIDGWRESHLGRLYRPKYFHEDGIAIHGYPRVPAHPASHGCVRVSMDAMDYLWPRMPIGTDVLVY